MLRDERKFKKFQKISVWVLFICVMMLLVLVGFLNKAGEEDTMAGIALILFLLTIFVAVIDMLAIVGMQIYLDVKENTVKEAAKGWLKGFVMGLAVGSLIVIVPAVWKKTGLHVEMLGTILQFAVIVCVGGYCGRFFSRKPRKD